MSDLQGFHTAARRAEHPGAVLTWQSRQSRRGRVRSRSGLFARCCGQVQFVENHRATGRFLQAMSGRYGREITREVATTRGLAGGLGRFKPLTARKVDEAVRAADIAQAAALDNNKLLARCTRRVESLAESPESVGAEIRKAVASHHMDNPTFARRVDVELVAATVEQEIIAAGRDGVHRVTPAEARVIRAEVVKREVSAANGDYFHAKARALEALAARKPGSIAFRALVDGFASFDPPLHYDGASLTADAAEELYREFSDAINSGRIGADQLDDGEALRALAEEVVGRFIAQREAARSEVRAFRYNPQETRQALLALVTRDNIPAGLVRKAQDTAFLVGAELARLVRPLPAEELESVVDKLHVDLTTTWREPGVEYSEIEEALAYRWVWRFVLASRGEDEAVAILGQTAPKDSPLRGIAEAAAWYAEEFDETAPYIGAARPARDARSFKPRASHIAGTLQSLWDTLHERTGWEANGGRVFKANAFPDDRAIASLRNLGVPFPAPGRLGVAQPVVPISNPAQTEMNEALGDHVRTSDQINRSGLARNCVNFLRYNETLPVDRFRARFFIDGRELPRNADAETVARAMKDFCRDTNGIVNENLLASVSRVFDHATIDCVYAGCMAPKRPDLAILDGYPEGVYEGHSYSLWKNDDGEVRLGVGEMITPLYFHRRQRSPADPAAPRPTDGAARPRREMLSGKASHFCTRALVKFDPESHRPEFGKVEIGYSLIRGGPERPYWKLASEGEGPAHGAEEGSSGRSAEGSERSSEHSYESMIMSIILMQTPI